MEFTFETVYNQKAVTTMARTLRKTLRKKRSRRSHIFGWIVLVIAVILTLPLGEKEFAINFKTIITWIAASAILVALLFEDRMNGYIARKRMLAGMDRAATVFNDESYVTTTSIGKTEFPYDHNIDLLAETKDYFVFIFDKSHAQVYDKHALAGGTLEEFRKFISEKTGKEIVHVA